MKTLALLLLVILVGCAAPEPYDQQFSVLETVNERGHRRSHAWVIGPTRLQQAEFEARRGGK